MLNDMARPTRLLMAGFGVSVGVVVGAVLAVLISSTGSVVPGIVIVGGALFDVVVLIVWQVFVVRADRRFRAHLVGRTGELAEGRAVGDEPVPGRVVRRRIMRRERSFMPGGGWSEPASLCLVCTALTPDGARRVAALVPAREMLLPRGTPVALLLHPDHDDAALLDDRVSQQHLAANDADPRWSTARLPTDRTVVGGWRWLAASLGAATVVVAAVTFGVLVVVV